MATLIKGTTFASGDVVTPAKLNNLVDFATLSPIITADIADSQITTAKISDSSITTAKISDSSITTAKIANSNVTTDKIANGAVTSAKLGSDIFFVPAGAVMAFAMNSAPSGWLAANGTAVSRTTYAALFAVIGTNYGTGDGSTTFAIPDLRGYFVRGSGTNADGTVSGTFGAKQDDAFQGHYHSITSSEIGGSGGTGAYTGASSGAGGTIRNDRVRNAVTDATNGTPRTASETRPANIAMLYCIKY